MKIEKVCFERRQGSWEILLEGTHCRRCNPRCACTRLLALLGGILPSCGLMLQRGDDPVAPQIGIGVALSSGRRIRTLKKKDYQT
jgi:hypothetical protein